MHSASRQRSLAVVATATRVSRSRLPGAILTRIAASHVASGLPYFAARVIRTPCARCSTM